MTPGPPTQLTSLTADWSVTPGPPTQLTSLTADWSMIPAALPIGCRMCESEGIFGNVRVFLATWVIPTPAAAGEGDWSPPTGRTDCESTGIFGTDNGRRLLSEIRGIPTSATVRARDWLAEAVAPPTWDTMRTAGNDTRNCWKLPTVCVPPMGEAAADWSELIAPPPDLSRCESSGMFGCEFPVTWVIPAAAAAEVTVGVDIVCDCMPAVLRT